MRQTNITPELIRAAMAHVPANCDRDTWARVAMAIKSEFPDEVGRDLFTEWSATGDSFDAKAVRDTWRSVKAGGGVTIGTLLHIAKEHGFDLPRPEQAPAAPPPEVLARRRREKAEHEATEQARTEAAQTRAAGEAAALWDAASESGASAYLARKGVQSYGVRFAADGWLLVPVRNEVGELVNLQRIAPAKPSDGAPDKLFLKGGRKRGCWHWCGDPAGAAVLMLAEGYATAASVHEATGRPVAVAFDAGNLAHVAKALHKRHPAALIVIAGDDDVQTHARSGANPGRDKAAAAARAVRGLAVFPEQLPEGGSDFNDLHQAAGLDAVREQIEASIDAHQAGQRPAQASNGRRTGQSGHERDAAPSGGAGDDGQSFDPFIVNDAGVWHQGVDHDGKPKSPEWVCSRLEVDALTRDQDGAGWGYLLSFADPLGHAKQWAMPSRILAGDGTEARATLMSMGLRIATAARTRNLLTQYIQTRRPGDFATCTDRIGWHGRAFVLPKETIGDDAERIVFQTDTAIENTFRSKGTPEQWRDRVAALCVGNSRLAFAVACAFAGPLLRPAGVESGGFHFRGDSSSGKTTALKVAASVYGGASYLQRWRTTDNALEATAAQHSDCLLILDELAQVDPKTAGECAYMLANEQSKARAMRTGAPRARLAWRLLFLSAGELGLSDHMAEGMKRTRTGQEVRMADIPTDAGAGMGAFERLHGIEGGAVFASHITAQAGSVHGAAGRAWLQWLTENAATLKARIREAAGRLAGQIVPEAASGQVERVGARFALVGAAGELATEAGLTGWPKGEAERAARACFNAWLAARGGIGNGEVVAMLRTVRRFLEAHGEGRFTWWHRAADDHNVKTLNRAGFRRMLNEQGEPIKSNSAHQVEYGERMPAALGENVSVEYFVLPEVFKAEMCHGFDPQAVAGVLVQHGCLTVKEQGRHSVTERLPGLGLSRCYRIPPAIFELDL
ncbi:MAG: DNA primase, phage-associated [Burkholderiaceae bacterium]|jgi:putative DNA primase/helicase|nr:MAG: DNA primase, phage-associated [Burkholderiaceae bacterium]